METLNDETGADVVRERCLVPGKVCLRRRRCAVRGLGRRFPHEADALTRCKLGEGFVGCDGS
jgi:hypothetical protein